MAEILAITNQKGGVGKTTTSLNLGVGLIRSGKRVLFVDVDPQCSLSYIMQGDSSQVTVQELLLRQATAEQAIQKTPEGDLIAASPGLSSMDLVLNQMGKEYRMREGLAGIAGQYDYIIIDSPPSLDVLTVNTLTAASQVIVPALADIFSLQGVGQLYSTIQAVKTYCNPNLKILGILLTRHTDRYILNRGMRELLEDTAREIGSRVFHSSVREAVVLREAQAARQSIFSYAPKSKQAEDYQAFVEEFLLLQGK